MAISPSGISLLDRRSGVQANMSAAQRPDIGRSVDWNQVLLDQEKIQARASLRPDMVASIRAAQNIWLAAQDLQPLSMPAHDSDMDIEAFIAMLVRQASEARRGI